jgi:hypothetical protein
MALSCAPITELRSSASSTTLPERVESDSTAIQKRFHWQNDPLGDRKPTVGLVLPKEPVEERPFAVR